jgi:hypothetical protein
MIGDGIEYIFTNARHTNPLCRVIPKDLFKEGKEFEYDKEKYRDMLLEAAETVLGYFGFHRTAYLEPPKKDRKWSHEIANRRAQDVENER